MTMDYSITWAYIVNEMRDKFNVGPDNTDKHSMYDFNRMIDEIWSEHVDLLDKKYKQN